MTMEMSVTQNVLMYFVLPLWLLAGLADYLCHRVANIEGTSGVKETLLHLLQFAEMAVPILAALFLQINALVILVMIVCFFLHEATALWDVSYANKTRVVTPIEQHVHSFLEMLPLMGLVLVIILHWDQFLSLFGAGSAPAQFIVALKQPPLPWTYIAVVLLLVLVLDLLPYLEELLRGLRKRREGLAPASRTTQDSKRPLRPGI
jgi:hypothetical protein